MKELATAFSPVLPAFLALIAILVGRPVMAEELIVALSSEEVKITSNFTGTGIAVFGAIERDAATISRGSFYDVVVVLKGPPETVVTRRKDRLLGIWLNSAARTYPDMPSFYAVNSSRPVAEVATAPVLKRFQLGFDNLAFETTEHEEAITPEDISFRDAFVRLKQQAGLFRQEHYGVTFPGTNVFQTTLQIPANVPVGRYEVAVYLFRDSAFLASDSAEIRISKTGFEQFTFDLAHGYGFLYGAICVVLAIFTGWLAGVIFRKD
ncbi:TIGR02186 family protein [Kaistia dalseonensis]|uniref:Uncharacterized protein (TIGR02186 family) n=1 Tax=Kaistia dalseonensis TaxID=410840 RepID=A0ABU0HDT9_9HYPH|nr:TIGR02186 family protein [Kaistia dalseonensis]MCX5497836.1 TIGR02186 family protein [Kaistia dalseonensis]MDQ0440480.1 uncharacterized protein (TIGR02186 family) [Kaistia dalseonensis]